MKKRGLDMKFYRQVAAISVAPTVIPAVGSWLEVTTVNKVSKKFEATKVTIETRESADDITLAAGKTSEFTIIIPVDLADPHYMALTTAANDQTTIACLFAVNGLTTADPSTGNVVEMGNMSVTTENSDEAKKEGVLVTFTLSPADGYYRRFVKSPS